jgi:hypothetical protein
MTRLKPSRDVQPLSAFRAHAAGFLEQVELIRDIRDARAEMARGEGIAHEEVVAELRSRLKR